MITTQAFKELTEHFNQMQQYTLSDLFLQDDNRFNQFHLTVNGLLCDFSKNNLTRETLHYLSKLAHESGLIEHINAMFTGQQINNTEQRAVLHTALRATNRSVFSAGKDVSLEVQQVLQQIQTFSNKLHSGQHLGYTGKAITDIVNIGIGGSDLGPALVCYALKPYRKNNLNIHFVSSVDGYQIYDVLASLNPETTLFIVASKTFTTQETITNAHTARKWFLTQAKTTEAIKQHFVAASTNLEAVQSFGINPEHMFQLWDFVGGRYSLWSAIGLAIVLYIGFENFSQLLAGARAMDDHFWHTTNLSNNLPVILALISIWYINFYNYPTQVVSTYNTRLSKLPAYIQQLEMESNGKAVDKDGNQLSYKTCPVIWGGSGSNGQHAYY
ncbi:MAG: glucose-6-phosphate isomerase, partial [Burkholderiales bacterium]